MLECFVLYKISYWCLYCIIFCNNLIIFLEGYCVLIEEDFNLYVRFFKLLFLGSRELLVEFWWGILVVDLVIGGFEIFVVVENVFDN